MRITDQKNISAKQNNRPKNANSGPEQVVATSTRHADLSQPAVEKMLKSPTRNAKALPMLAPAIL
jgi:hypothetical protein